MADTELRLTVRNMKCNGCVARAREAVCKIEGVESVEFDVQQGRGVVKGVVDSEAVIHALTKLGYPAARNS